MDTSFELGRLPFDVQLCPSWRGFFARFWPLEQLLAAAFRFVRLGWAPASVSAPDKRVASSVGTVALATQQGLSRPDLELLVQDCVDGLPETARRSIFRGTQKQAEWNAYALVPLGDLSGMVVTGGLGRARNARLCSLEWGRLYFVFRGLSPVSPRGEDPSKSIRERYSKVVN